MRSRITYILLLFALFIAACNQAKLSDARSQYLRGEYHAASETYRKLYRNTPQDEQPLRGVIAFEMAENYRALNQSARAEVAYTNAIRFDYPDTMMHLSYARMLHRQGKYRAAADAYHNFLRLQPDHPLAMNGLEGVATAEHEQLSRYVVRRMDLFNSARSEFSPMLARRDNMLYFTSSRDEASGEIKSPVTGMKYNDLFFSEKDVNGVWKRPEPLPDEINTDFDEGTPSITADGEWMYYTFSGADSGDPALPTIYYSKRVNGSWSAGRPLQIGNWHTPPLIAHPAISPSGRYLYFVSDMLGGMGGKDIWRVEIMSGHKVGVPENLGTRINSAGNEMFPYVRNDSTLYFSSDGLPGRGGLDLFMAVNRQQTNDWQVSSLPIPLNSPADDFGITFMRDAEQGFFSSNRDDARGYDHIFSFVYPETTILVTGFAVDQEDEFIRNATVRVVGSDGSQQQFVTNGKGEYQFKATGGIDYLFMATADGFLNQKKTLRTTAEEKDTTYYVDFEMIHYDKPVVLEHIFYDFNRALLRPESKRELDKLVVMLLDHPEISIELTAHTDRKGDDAYNRELSSKRAQAAAGYLMENGIEGGRIAAVGLGKKEPKRVSRSIAAQFPFLQEGDVLTDDFIRSLAPDQQAVADQINRRTEFRVVGPTFFTP